MNLPKFDGPPKDYAEALDRSNAILDAIYANCKAAPEGRSYETVHEALSLLRDMTPPDSLVHKQLEEWCSMTKREFIQHEHNQMYKAMVEDRWPMKEAR